MNKKYGSRKLHLTLFVLVLTFIPMILKFNNENFLQYFKTWCQLAIAIGTVYIGGNIGQKFSRKNSQQKNTNKAENTEKIDNSGDGI